MKFFSCDVSLDGFLWQVVNWGLVGVWKDMRRWDEDEDSLVYAKNWPCWRGDTKRHLLFDSPSHWKRVLQQPVLPTKVGQSGMVWGKTTLWILKKYTLLGYDQIAMHIYERVSRMSCNIYSGLQLHFSQVFNHWKSPAHIKSTKAVF